MNSLFQCVNMTNITTNLLFTGTEKKKNKKQNKRGCIFFFFFFFLRKWLHVNVNPN